MSGIGNSRFLCLIGTRCRSSRRGCCGSTRYLRGIRILLGYAGQALRKNVRGAHRGRTGSRTLRLRRFSNDQDFFQPVEISGRFYFDDQKWIVVAVGYGVAYRADGESFGKDTVAAAGNHVLASFNFFVGHHVTDLQLAQAGALQNALQARALQDHTGAAFVIVHEQDLGAQRINLFDLANDSVGRDYCHVRFKTVTLAFIDRNHF